MILFLSPSFAFASPRIIDLGTYNGRNIYVYAVNSSNHLAGSCQVSVSDSHPCFYNGTNWVDLGGFGGQIGFANSLNDSDQVVGVSYDANLKPHAFLWQTGVLTDLGDLSTFGSSAVAINNHGQVVGYSYIVQNQSHATLWENGQIKDLGTLPGGNISSANSINNNGDIVGISNVASGDYHAFVFRNNQMADLGGIKTNTTPLAVNDFRQFVGFTTNVPGADDAAFSYKNGNFVTLPWNSGPSWARDINNKGLVVGFGYNAPQGGVKHATLWVNNSVTELGSLSASGISEASSINDTNVIAGDSPDSSGINHAVLWTKN
ncbi:hypothetical protein HY025_05290 [Candidatus Daviesbacteria bacterium]|nr:hypothetical protein [Candidatus Daviesbacteria bacterium]